MTKSERIISATLPVWWDAKLTMQLRTIIKAFNVCTGFEEEPDDDVMIQHKGVYEVLKKTAGFASKPNFVVTKPCQLEFSHCFAGQSGIWTSVMDSDAEHPDLIPTALCIILEAQERDDVIIVNDICVQNKPLPTCIGGFFIVTRKGVAHSDLIRRSFLLRDSQNNVDDLEKTLRSAMDKIVSILNK